MATSADVRDELAGLADPRRAEGVRRLLQMVPGGYGEGDRAIGVSVPEQRRVAGRYWRDLSLAETAMLLKSVVHEERLTSLFILVQKFTKGDEEERGRILHRPGQHRAHQQLGPGGLLRAVHRRTLAD